MYCSKHYLVFLKLRINISGLFKRSALKLETKAKNKSEDEIERCTPSDWLKSKMRPRRPAGLVLSLGFVLINLILGYTKPKKGRF